MNHPVIAPQTDSRRRINLSGLITAAVCGGCAVLLLLPQSEQETAAGPARVFETRTGQAEAAPAAAATVPTANPAAAAPVQLGSVAEMNRLADSAAPIDQKMASLAQAMRHSDPRIAAEAARRAVFLIKSADYVQLAGPLLLDTTISPAAMQVLGLNVHDRDPGCTLPLLAKICAMPGHPLQAEAADTLVFYLGGNARTLSGTPLENAVSDWLAGRKIAGP